MNDTMRRDRLALGFGVAACAARQHHQQLSRNITTTYNVQH
jgi:hypothetical protein